MPDVHGKPAEGNIRANFTVDKKLWAEAIAKAKSEGTVLAEELRQFLREYVATKST
jgi:hypothetical protein